MNDWIAVVDELPPVEEHILVFDGGVGTAFFKARHVEQIAASDRPWRSLTHWMRFPGPPG